MGLVLVAGAVLLGWTLESRILTSLMPGLVPMNPVTAVAFALAGASLTLSTATAGRRHAVLGRAAAAVVALLGLAVLARYALGWEWHLDAVLFSERLARVPYGPNRMAPNTALAFVLSGLALGLLDVETGRGRRPSQALALVVAIIGLLAVTGYGYGAAALQRVTLFIPMALNTALCFTALAVGVLFARPDRGVMRIVTGGGPGGVTARRLLSVAILVPWLLGWCVLAGQIAALYDERLGVAIFAVSMMIVHSAVVLWNAGTLDRADRKRRRAEEALDEHAARLEAANGELEAFGYSVSHDLRAPLRAIDGFTRILLEDHAERLDAEGRRVLGIVCDNARRMGELIDALLAFSRLGRKEIEQAPVDMRALAQAVAAETRGVEPGLDVEIAVGALARARADANLVREVLANLIGNAVKFSRGREPARVEVGSRPEGTETVYFVRDGGAGFDMRYADKLFQVFQRLHRQDEFPGTGIGLALVKRIVTRHGGRVWAEGEVGRGATFYFTLPTAEEA